MKASSADAKPHGGVAPTGGSSAWAPFRSQDFARMASAQFVSNIGSWMQTVGAQEPMLTLTTSATMVALIQTAAGLPVVLLSVPAGAIGDLVDRRRLLIASQSFMLIAALLLAGLAFAGLVTPLILLALIFAVGIGQTLTSPVWQTLQPELVAPEDRTQAISLGAGVRLGDALRPGRESEAERAPFRVPTDSPPRPGMDHASPKRGYLLERDLHVVDGEVGQRSRVARAGATFVNAEHKSRALGLPAATFGLAALGELDAEQARPEPTGAVGIISRELDQADWSVHAKDDNGARADRAPSPQPGLGLWFKQRDDEDQRPVAARP